MLMRLLLAILYLAAPHLSIGQAMESGGQPAARNVRTYPLDLTGRITKPTCVNIPEDLSLCQNIGYSQMRMPNLLDHVSMDEVKHQAQSWVPLLLQHCHDDTQLFLCTLFAPVCLDRPIYPCRSLCEAVRAGCGPLMESNCFPWPSMLDCAKFPSDNDMCIKSEMRGQNGTEGATSFELPSAMQEQYLSLFTQCHDDTPQETVIKKYCTSDFVLKMKIKTIKESKDGKKYIGDGSGDKLQVIKQGSLKNKDLKRLTFYVREGANCRCSMLEDSGNYLLVMGHRDSQKSRKLFMTFVHTWHKTRDFRRKMKALEDPNVCTTLANPPRVDSDGADTSNAHVPSTQDVSSPSTAAQMTGSQSQTNSPMYGSVPPAEQVMSDETPPTPPTPVTRSGNNRRRNRRRPRKGKPKGSRRELREVNVGRAMAG